MTETLHTTRPVILPDIFTITLDESNSCPINSKSEVSTTISSSGMTLVMLFLKIVHVTFEGGPDETLKNKLYCSGIEYDGEITETCMT